MRDFRRFLANEESNFDFLAEVIDCQMRLLHEEKSGSFAVGDDVIAKADGETIHGVIKSIDGDDAEVYRDSGDIVMAKVGDLEFDKKFYDGHWLEPLPKRSDIDSGEVVPSNSYTYRFNVLGDGCGERNENPCRCLSYRGHNPTCYSVNISGDPRRVVSISFFRGGEYTDMKITRKMYRKKSDGSVETIKVPIGPGVFAGVMHAVGEYIKTLKPVGMSWTPVEKTDISGAVRAAKIKRTPEQIDKFRSQTVSARKNVYETWSIKNLFPDKFVGIFGNWISRDAYDKNFVPQGFPEVPKTILIPKRNKDGDIVKNDAGETVYSSIDVNADSDGFVKSKAFEVLSQKINSMSNPFGLLSRIRTDMMQDIEDDIERSMQVARRNRAERMAARANELAADRANNPSGIKVGDIARFNYIRREFAPYALRCFKVLGFSIINERSDQVMAKLQFQKNPTSAEFDIEEESDNQVDLLLLTKVDSVRDHIKWYKGKIEEKRRSEGIDYKEGDTVIGSIDPMRRELKQRGKVLSFSLRTRGVGSLDDIVFDLRVKVQWDDETVKMWPRFLSSDAEIDADLLRKEKKEDRRAKRDDIEKMDDGEKEEIKIQTPANLDAILSHPHNRERLKPGDHFMVSHFSVGNKKKGVITSMRIKNNILYASLRVLNARSGPGVSRAVELPVTYIQRDTSSAANQPSERQQGLDGGNFGIGDKVFVSSGLNYGKSGRIASFRMIRGAQSAVISTDDGQQFTAKVSTLMPVVSTSQNIGSTL